MSVNLKNYTNGYDVEVTSVKVYKYATQKEKRSWPISKNQSQKKKTIIKYLLGIEIDRNGKIYMTSMEIKCLRWLDLIKKQLYFCLGVFSLLLTVILFTGSLRNLTQDSRNQSSTTNIESQYLKRT